MDKNAMRGFTLMELLIALGVLSIVLVAAAPFFNEYMQQQQLKLVAAQITAQIQNAKSMSASTECRSQINLQQDGPNIRVAFELHLDQQWKGCQRWFESRGVVGANHLQLSSQLINNARLDSNVLLEFQGVSGSLNTTQARSFRLHSGTEKMSVTLDGIGNGVHQYEYDN